MAFGFNDDTGEGTADHRRVRRDDRGGTEAPKPYHPSLRAFCSVCADHQVWHNGQREVRVAQNTKFNF